MQVDEACVVCRLFAFVAFMLRFSFANARDLLKGAAIYFILRPWNPHLPVRCCRPKIKRMYCNTIYNML